ncbi:lysozyme [Azospirillum picis]|uniref:Lysozyme n=1 Tax=Azospirillum picis TaxID=488438 RepID=A0ABU0MQ82_9PROT|nr:lysozyme [Azospirillum picis]MBP2301687.1 lysozyme [Azospirillum picis]MDQ0535489.1 lysozyme [Azospirillum picis]
MTTKPVCQAAVDLVKHFEGLYLQAYRCPAGVATIGYGHTTGVEMGQSIILQQADAFLADDLTDAAAHVDGLVKVPMNDDQRGALASFVFNLGAGSLASSTLLRMLNAGDATGAAGQFGRWVYAVVDGRKTQLPGLVARRAAEAALFAGQTAQAHGGVTTEDGST